MTSATNNKISQLQSEEDSKDNKRELLVAVYIKTILQYIEWLQSQLQPEVITYVGIEEVKEYCNRHKPIDSMPIDEDAFEEAWGIVTLVIKIKRMKKIKKP